ncbi:MAG TPA: signal peptide peptidase SppA, partial [Thermodesulfobacteriota bacterium]|nr:signal peptide peptidase SppA [Thermodesulfobacteriota bacterium]
RAKGRLLSAVARLRRESGIIAVVTDTGFITLGKSTGRGGTKTMGSGSVLAELDKVSKDRDVKGLVFRVLTPGGSGVASDLIREKLRELSERLPVIISMSDVSASGGYLIALGAGRIVADPMTLTGSIGIVSGKFEIGGLLKKLGVGKELVPTAKRSLMFSQSRDFSDDEEGKLDEMMNFYYKEFVRAVAEGRGLDENRAGEAAKGRVWTGAQAKELGLVDEMGGFWDAVNVAAREAGLPQDKAPLLRYYSSARGIKLASLFGDTAYSEFVRMLSESVPPPGLHGCFTVMPFRIDVK